MELFVPAPRPKGDASAAALTAAWKPPACTAVGAEHTPCDARLCSFPPTTPPPRSL